MTTTEQKKPTQLVIKTNSWHYKHFCRIRRFYGMDTKPTMTTSLCPYVQTMIWGSVIMVLTLPLQVIGWLTLKIGRWLYKIAEASGMTKLTDYIDRVVLGRGCSLGDVMDRSQDKMEIAPFWVLMAWGFASIIATIFVLAVVSIVCLALVVLVTVLIFVVMSMPQWPAAIGLALSYIGWAVTIGAWGVVQSVIITAQWVLWLLGTIGGGILWFFTAGWLWWLFLQIFLWIVAIVLACAVLGWPILKICNSKCFTGSINFLVMRFNGYHEARRHAAERRRVEAEKFVEPKKKEPKIYKAGWAERLVLSFHAKCSEMFEGIFEFFFSREIDVAGTTKKILSPCAMVWAVIWAVKKKACPLVTFEVYTTPPVPPIPPTEEELLILLGLSLDRNEEVIAKSLNIDLKALSEHLWVLWSRLLDDGTVEEGAELDTGVLLEWAREYMNEFLDLKVEEIEDSDVNSDDEKRSAEAGNTEP